MTTVIIPTVGVGSRMSSVSTDLNKALLPYKNKPILAHIIDQFPIDSKFIIPVGHLQEQIVDFCQLAYGEYDIEFVYIEDWTDEDSGPGTTLAKCESRITEPFWYVPCDTYFDEPVTKLHSDRYFVKRVPVEMTPLYTMFLLDYEDRIVDISFKLEREEHWVAFTGLMYIHEHNDFFDRLRLSNSNELVFAIEGLSKVAPLMSWLDFGNPKIYEDALVQSRKYDFTKKDEITYLCNNRVVKWWRDESIALAKIHKLDFGSTKKNEIYPNNVEYSGNWVAYDFCPGETMYAHSNPSSFGPLLTFLDEYLWNYHTMNIEDAATEFYHDKTLHRIAMFKNKYPFLPNIAKVDGVPISEDIIIDWDLLIKNSVACYMHGDLQFDNIIVNMVNGAPSFKLIDWRPTFAGIIWGGDIYYDLAKLYGGLIIDYSKVKEGNFGIDRGESEIKLHVPRIDHYDLYINELTGYIESKKLNIRKVTSLVPIIFLNMAPLHAAPFDQILWYLGLRMLHENIL